MIPFCESAGAANFSRGIRQVYFCCCRTSSIARSSSEGEALGEVSGAGEEGAGVAAFSFEPRSLTPESSAAAIASSRGLIAMTKPISAAALSLAKRRC